jgi:hypothetical protein
MGITERLIVVALALVVIVISFMLFMLGLFFLQNRKRSEEFFMKSFSEQMKSLGFFRDIPLFGPAYFVVGTWYVRTFPRVAEAPTDDRWSGQGTDHPVWLNKQTVQYFVIVVSAMLMAYSVITALVSVGGISLMLNPYIGGHSEVPGFAPNL